MSIMGILDTLLLKPIQLIFEVVYAISYRLLNDPGISIIVLSLIMNFLVLPLYKRADAMQEDERRMEMLLQKGVAHIKKTFSGDEQMLMLRTYYRQNNYKPSYVLRGATSLLLEIPFFIAAYRFLSNLQLLNGADLGPIADLGQPDRMLQIAGLTINLLPFVMTAVNLVSCIIFTQNSPIKTKLQLYGMAAFFLFFLYSSPSGLVFYWTLNNFFSLIKTIFYKLKNPRRILNILFSTAGVGIWIYGFFIYATPTPKLTIFYVILGILMQAPTIGTFLKKHSYFKPKVVTRSAHRTVFLSGGLFLSVLMGVLIPSTVIKSSPQEFISGTFFYHPSWFIASSFCMALGTFVIWMGVFYWLASPSVKSIFDRAIWIFSGIAIIDYMFFNQNFGNLTSRLKYEDELEYMFVDQLWNFTIIAVSSLVLYTFYQHFEKKICEILIVGIAAFSIMSFSNISYINISVAAVQEQMKTDTEMPNFTLSKTGKNVVVLMLDRAMGEQIPYIFNEKPELKRQFDGFTYYSNTMSFGGSTNLGVPALLGGYEYTPVEMNSRPDESLVSKHNEALKVMPVLFTQNNYEVTVCNPVYANYHWTPDPTIYDDYPSINCYVTGDKFVNQQNAKIYIENNNRNFFCFSILKSIPLFAQKTVYNNGNYNKIEDNDDNMYSGQNLISPVLSEGINELFMESYSVLENLPAIGTITNENVNTFLLMINDTTHEPMLLQEPDYVPLPKVDNTTYENPPFQRSLDGRILKLETENQMIHYHTNMATMIQLGKWFDFLRQEDVYDNTRIILVSDHGRNLYSLDNFVLDDTCLSYFCPLLMVKDFASKGFTTSDEFMTNGDVPTLAVNGIINNPENPFTGKLINSTEKTTHEQYIISIDSDNWKTDVNNGNTFTPTNWYSVHDNIWDIRNWRIIAEDAVLTSTDY